MLPRLVLLIIQIAAAFWLAEPVKTAVRPFIGNQYDIFQTAVAYAIIITIVGFVGALILKGLRVPTIGTFVLCLLLALILAGVTLVPQAYGPLQASVPYVVGRAYLLPLIGAIVGYIIKR